MARPRNLVPTYRKHSKSGRAAISIYRADGTRTEIVLPGTYGSDESKEAYESLLAQLRANGGKLPGPAPGTDLTISELVERFMREHVEQHHRRPDGTPTGEKANYVMTVRPLVRLFGSKPAREFSPLDLRTYRDACISGTWMNEEEKKKRQKTRGHDGTTNRKTTNGRVGRIKKMFKWAGEMMIVPPTVWHGLQTVSGLQAGRGVARESKEVEPVPLEHVESTLEHLPEIIADIVRTQMFSGARAGEILRMRTCDIDQAAAPGVWVYTPSTHKNAWRGHKRKIVFGPRVQLVLRKYLTPDSPETFMFRPGTVRPGGSIQHRDQYDVVNLDKSIARAAKKAGVAHWSSHQLRHAAARLAEKEISIEGARAFLGQKSVNMACHYSGLDVAAAAEVARLIG